MPKTGYVLAKSPQDIETYLATYRNKYNVLSVDTEASSLNTRKLRLAGVSLSLLAGTGIYCPFGHKLGSNLPLEPSIKIIRDFVEKLDMTVLNYNSKYDVTVIEERANWTIKKYLDVLELVYLENPDRLGRGLKAVSKAELGLNMVEFEDLFSSEEKRSKKTVPLDITTKPASRIYEYACEDADATLRLFELPKFNSILTQFPLAVKVDTILVEVIRRLEHDGGLELDIEYVDKQIKSLTARAEALKEQIWRVTGVQFEINSPTKLGEVLFGRMGLPNEGLTKTGKYKTDADVMENLALTEPIAEYVVSYRKVVKAASTYFKKLRVLHEEDIPVRFNLNQYAAPTFRLAAPGGDPKEDGATGVNLQAVSNGEDREMPAVDLTLREMETVEEDSDLEVLVEAEVQKTKASMSTKQWKGLLPTLPYVVESRNGLACFREICKGCPAECASQGIDIVRRPVKGLKMIPSVRNSFRVPKGYTLVSFDYDRQELVIGANISGETVWLDALEKGEDLHKRTTCDAYQLTESQFDRLSKLEQKEKRDIGKMVNFAIFFGATDYSIARKARIAQALATQIYTNITRGLPVLMSWIEKTHIFSRKNGYTTTYFGRKRPLAHLYNHPDPKMRGFADRSSVNTCVQGTGADVTRIAMVKVHEAFRREGITKDVARLVMSIHDELAYMIKDECLDQIVPIIIKNMAFFVKGWRVQLTVTPKKGKIWGKQE